jgi:hypothetical protein
MHWTHLARVYRGSVVSIPDEHGGTPFAGKDWAKFLDKLLYEEYYMLMTTRIHITEAAARRLIERRVVRALATSYSYLAAENAEEQAAAEQRITQEIERDVYREYVVGS